MGPGRENSSDAEWDGTKCSLWKWCGSLPCAQICYLLYTKSSSVLHLSKKKIATKQGMGQNISCLTQLNEEISEVSQLVSIPNPLLGRWSGSDGSNGIVQGQESPNQTGTLPMRTVSGCS